MSKFDPDPRLKGTVGLNKEKRQIGLPYRPFLFTLDQVAALLSVTEQDLIVNHVYFEGRSTGPRSMHYMVARDIRNLSQPESKPEWRITDREVLRWMKLKGFKHYEGIVIVY